MARSVFVSFLLVLSATPAMDGSGGGGLKLFLTVARRCSMSSCSEARSWASDPERPSTSSDHSCNPAAKASGLQTPGNRRSRSVRPLRNVAGLEPPLPHRRLAARPQGGPARAVTGLPFIRSV